MPTLNKRVDKSDRLHPRQTDYYITAKPPDIGYITYQLDSRAVTFLTETCEYTDGDDLPWSLVHTLRQIRDLYTLEEGRPRNANPEPSTSEQVTVPSLSSDTMDALGDYLASHPDVIGDIGAFRTRLAEKDSSYTDVIERSGYTPDEPLGFESSGDGTLDRIAEQYFGDDTDGYIEWDGSRIYDYIEITDRDGNVHKFPKIDGRLKEGELLRLSRDLYERWGPQIGESDVNSRRYEPSEDGFPNRWIGQREHAPEPSLDHAKSPRAFYYRTIAGRSHYAPGKEAEEAFETVCEYSLEVYKANFPTAVDPNDLETEYVTVEEATKPWNDFQVPPGWGERYSDNGGLPPLKRDSEPSLPEHAQAIIERHSPGGSASQWFSSVEEGREYMTEHPYRDLLIAADQSEYYVTDFHRSGAAHPIFNVEFEHLTAYIQIDRTECLITYESTTGETETLVYDGETITEWNFPDELSVSDSTIVLEELSNDLEEAASFAERLQDLW